MLAIGGGEPLGPTGCFIAATVCAAVALLLLVYTLHPKLRESARWDRGGQGPQMSMLSGLVWVLNALLWGIASLAQGLQYAPLKSRGFWLVGGGFVLLTLAAVRDNILDRRK